MKISIKNHRNFLGSRWNVLLPFGFQQYPPGTQENYNRFSSGNPITEKGKELEYPEGAGGGKGYEDREAVFNLTAKPLREPGVPPIGFNKIDFIQCRINIK